MRILTLLLLLLISIPAFSQSGAKLLPKNIKVGEVKEAGVVVAELYYTIVKKDTTYVITYKNWENLSAVEMQSISFNGKNNAAGKLYELLSSFFGDPDKQENGYKLTTKIGNEDVTISLATVMNSKVVMIITTHGYFNLTEMQVNNLFYP